MTQLQINNQDRASKSVQQFFKLTLELHHFRQKMPFCDSKNLSSGLEAPPAVMAIFLKLRQDSLFRIDHSSTRRGVHEQSVLKGIVKICSCKDAIQRRLYGDQCFHRGGERVPSRSLSSILHIDGNVEEPAGQPYYSSCDSKLRLKVSDFRLFRISPSLIACYPDSPHYRRYRANCLYPRSPLRFVEVCQKAAGDQCSDYRCGQCHISGQACFQTVKVDLHNVVRRDGLARTRATRTLTEQPLIQRNFVPEQIVNWTGT